MRCNPVMPGSYRKGGSLLVVMALLMLALPVRAEMLVSPLRVHLDDDKRVAMVILRNPSDGPRTYRLEWLEQRMAEDGIYSEYKPGEAMKHSPASPYLRLSPRQITVQPNSNQSVRVEYRPGKEMAPGEYRSHLMFRVVEEVSEPYSVEKMGDDKGMTLTLNMQLNIAIPVVVKHQLSEPPQVKIASVDTLPPPAPGQAAQLSILLQRTGLSGSFGQLVVDMQRNADAPVERIGMAENISVFADVPQRRVVLNLRDANIPAGAWLRVAYEGMDEYAGTLWDEQIFQVR